MNMTIKQQDNVDRLLAWSVINDKPVCQYIEEYDETLVAWNEVLMTKTQAMSLTLERYNKYPTPEMKKAMFNTFRHLYMTGFFGEQNWDTFIQGNVSQSQIDNFHSYMRKIILLHIKETIGTNKISKVLGWFIT